MLNRLSPDISYLFFSISLFLLSLSIILVQKYYCNSNDDDYYNNKHKRNLLRNFKLLFISGL